MIVSTRPSCWRRFLSWVGRVQLGESLLAVAPFVVSLMMTGDQFLHSQQYEGCRMSDPFARVLCLLASMSAPGGEARRSGGGG